MLDLRNIVEQQASSIAKMQSEINSLKASGITEMQTELTEMMVSGLSHMQTEITDHTSGIRFLKVSFITHTHIYTLYFTIFIYKKYAM